MIKQCLIVPAALICVAVAYAEFGVDDFTKEAVITPEQKQELKKYITDDRGEKQKKNNSTQNTSVQPLTE